MSAFRYRSIVQTYCVQEAMLVSYDDMLKHGLHPRSSRSEIGQLYNVKSRCAGAEGLKERDRESLKGRTERIVVSQALIEGYEEHCAQRPGRQSADSYRKEVYSHHKKNSMNRSHQL